MAGSLGPHMVTLCSRFCEKRQAGRPWDNHGHQGKSTSIPVSLAGARMRRIVGVGVGRGVC